jgi:hypothetical protein
MLNSRLNAARRIASALVPSETDVETAIASTARLILTIAEAHSEAKVPIAMCQDSLAALSTTIAKLTEARAAIAEAHAALATDRVNAGLSAYGMGDVGECPPASGSLTLVAGNDVAV